MQIFAETVLDIAFTLAARDAMAPEDIKTIGAYPVAAAQVRETLAARFPDAQVVTSASNAAAAKDVADGVVDAAVTTPVAARLHDLHDIATGIVDSDEANTRFVLVGKPGSGAAADRPGPHVGDARPAERPGFADVGDVRVRQPGYRSDPDRIAAPAHRRFLLQPRRRRPSR